MVRKFSSIALTVILTKCEAFQIPLKTFPSDSYYAGVRESVARSPTNSISRFPLLARRRSNENDDDYYNDNANYDDEDPYNDDERDRRRNSDRKKRRKNLNDRQPLDIPSPFNLRGLRLPQSMSKSLLAGVFFLGIGFGVTVDSQINTSPKDLASRDAIDEAAPNSRLCATSGASAMAFDQRVFVSFNPFNVYVAQADVKPACVLKTANIVPTLRSRGLINDAEVRSCKSNMNTWAFVGNLDDTPQLSCVYKSEDAQNEFLSNPKYGIGEDVYDDDRQAIEAMIRKKRQNKVKGRLTEGEREGERTVAAKAAAKAAAALKVDGAQDLVDEIPGQ